MAEAVAAAQRMSAQRDASLIARLIDLHGRAGKGWEQPNDLSKHALHGLFQYPAMMVPQMQREILAAMIQDFECPVRVWDPFVGSGTTLAESMMLGLDFVGRDINPLAVLICRVKAGPYDIAPLTRSVRHVLARAAGDKSRSIEILFPNWRKWFRFDAALAISRLRRAIRSEPHVAWRRFHWLALAETVRLCSNSRVSTVKLHSRPAKEIVSRKIDVLSTFRQILAHNLARLGEQRAALDAAKLLSGNRYIGDVVIELGDVRHIDEDGDLTAQILLTSPPYGDNVTTVPYGQSAYLPLQCIDLCDIDSAADESFLASTHAIDAMSLGGSKRIAEKLPEELGVKSSALRRTFLCLEDQPRDRTNRVAAFFRDLDEALPPILARLAPDALMAWTVGNRRVGGRSIPLDTALAELLRRRSAHPICKLDRRIPQQRKRMAKKNDHAKTITRERVLVFRGNQ